MALPASGAISLLDIQNTMGGSNPIGINEYYRGGANVPNITENNAIPTSGQISFSNFYSTYGRVTSNHTLTVGYIAPDKFTTEAAGYNPSASPSIGSLSPTTYSSTYGTLTINHCYWSGLEFVSFNVNNTNNTHFVFYEIVINGTTFTRSSGSHSTSGSNSIWTWGTATNPFGTSGNITLTVRRYG